MHGTAVAAPVLATVNKHHLIGIVAIVVGALAVLVVLLKFAKRAIVTSAVLTVVPLAGLVVLVLGILLYARVI